MGLIHQTPSQLLICLADGTIQRVGSFGVVDGPSAEPGTYLFVPSGMADDYFRLQALADSLIGLGATIQFLPGEYRNTVQFELRQGHPRMHAGPGCRFIANQEKLAATPFPACFYFTPTLLGPTTTTAAAAAQQRVIVVASVTEPPIGDNTVIEIETGAQYDVIGAPTGSAGAWQLTLDRPLAYPVAPGTNVRVVTSHPKDWVFDYAGAEVTGETCRYWSISRAESCCIKNAICTDRNGVADCLGSFDNTGRFNRFERVEYRTINGAFPANGLVAETNEGTVAEHCRLPGCGIYFDGTWGAILKECTGLYFQFAADQTAFPASNRVEGGTYGRMSHGSTGGMAGTVLRQTVRDVTFNAQSNLVAQVSGPASGLVFENCTWNLLQVPSQAFASARVVSGLAFKHCGFTANRLTYSAVPEADRSVAITIGGATGTHEVLVEDVTVTDMTAISVGQGASRITVNRSTFDVRMVGNGSAVPCLAIAGTTCDFTATKMTLLNPEAPGYATKLQASAGHYRLHDCVAAGYFWGVGAGAGPASNVRLTGTSVGAVNCNSVMVSPGVATIAGASVDVSFVSIRAGEVPAVVQLTGVATPPKVTVVAGTGFTIFGAAGNYAWAL